MRDYNFFEIYEKKKGMNINPKSSVFVCGVLLFLVLLATGGLIGWNYYISSGIDSYRAQTASIKASEDYAEANRLQESVDALEEYDRNAEITLQKFEKYNLIGTQILTTLSSAVPVQASLTTMTLNHAFMDSSFRVPDRKTASELILSLKETGLFHYVHLSSMAADAGAYKANIQCIMKAKENSGEEDDQNE